MALCVTLNADGTLTQTGDSVDQCAGYVLVSGSEYGVFQVVQDSLSMPTPEVMAEWFSAPFFMAVSLHFVAMFVGKIAGFFDDK